MDDPGDTRLIRFLTLLAWLTPVPLVVLVTGLAGLHEKRYDILWFGMAGLLAGPGLMGAIWLLGKLAQLHRAILLVVFGPGLMLTNLALVPLLAYNGGLATAFFGVFFFPLGIVLGIGTLFSVVTVFGRSLAFPFARGALGYQRGVVIGTEWEPRLWVLVREVAQQVGTEPPRQIVVGLEPSFFVTTARMKVISSERDLVTSEEEDAASAVRGRTLYLSLPFCRIMTDCELRAVLAHELGHFRGRDSRYSQAFNPLWRGAVRQLVRMKEDIEEGLWRGLPLRPAFYVLRFYLECFKEAEARVNRTRELAADQVSVRVTDHQTVATALVKIHGFGRYWKRALALLRERIARAEAELNASALFALAAEEGKSSVWLRRDLDEEEPPHPTDSHPPLSQRLAPLGLTIQDVAAGAFTVQPEAPASALLDDVERYETGLTQIEKRIMVETHQVFEGSKRY